MSIQKEGMIANLQVGVWQGYRLDKTTTLKVTQEADAAADAARVNKHLLPKEALSEIVCAAGAVRQHFYSKTLPWKDNGDRLLTRKVSLQFIQDHEELCRTFHSAVRDFLDRKYLVAKDQAEFRMGALFNAEDYPTSTDLRRKFYINLDLDAVAPALDIRFNDNTDAMQTRVTKAVHGLWEKMAKPLENFAATMGDADIKFRNATVDNLREMVELLPSLNFTDDPALEKIRRDIEQQLVIYDPADLRKDKKVRAAVAAEAREIMDEMAGFMNAFGSGSDDDGQ